MKSHLKKLTCTLLALLMLISIMPASTFAANETAWIRPLKFEENIATELKGLGLFKGVSDTDFALDRVPTRIEALVIMLRLMGKEAEILSGSYSHPFTDVPDWANNYVGYAYQNKLTNGISKSLFGTDNASDSQFITFILRAMGYSDAKGDFTWDNPFKLAEGLGVINDAVFLGEDFLRADCASISYYALGAVVKDGGKTLAAKLISENVFTKEAYDAATTAVPDYPGVYKAYGLSFHKKATSIDDLYDNVCYYMAQGAFEWTNDGTGNLSINALSILKPEIAGVLMNQGRQFCMRNGKCYIKLVNSVTSPYTPAEISNQIISAYSAAKTISNHLHSSNLISASSTEKQIATLYSNYLQSYGVKTPEGFANGASPSDYNNASSRIKYCIYDTAYGALVDKKAVCGGKAAAYNLCLAIEGIKSVGLHVASHMVSYLQPDGNEYFCDWGNNYGLYTTSDITVALEEYFEGNWLEVSREYYQRGATMVNALRRVVANLPKAMQDMPALELTKLRSDSTYNYYKVRLADTSYTGTSLRVIFGDLGYYFIYEPIPIATLKSGLTIQIKKSEIADYDIPEMAFFAPADWK